MILVLLLIDFLMIFFLVFFIVYICIFGIQFMMISRGSDKWINSIDNQLSKRNICYINTSYGAGARFISYCFKFPFIYKRAKTKDKKFYIIMTLNSIYVYTMAIIFVLIFVGIIPIDSVPL